MRNLIAANLHRLRASRFFWILEGTSVLLSAGICFLCALNRSNLGREWLLSRATSYCFMPALVLPFFAALFCGFFLGQDMENGTIRNRLATGHSRLALYLTDLITCAGSVLLFLVSHLLLFLTVGPVVAGPEILSGLDRPVTRTVCLAAILLSFTALFVLLNRLDTSSFRSRTMVLSLLLTVAMLAAGIFIFARLAEPEFQEQMVVTGPDTYDLLEQVPNSHYLRGPIRAVFQVLDLLLPSAQVLHTATSLPAHAAPMPLCSLLLCIFLTAAGIRLFRHRDLT